MEFIYSQRGHPLIVLNNYLYRKNRDKYWRCLRCTKFKCKARVIFRPEDNSAKVIGKHTHDEETEKIEWGRGLFSALKLKHENPTQLKKFIINQPHTTTVKELKSNKVTSYVDHEEETFDDDPLQETNKKNFAKTVTLDKTGSRNQRNKTKETTYSFYEAEVEEDEINYDYEVETE